MYADMEKDIKTKFKDTPAVIKATDTKTVKARKFGKKQPYFITQIMYASLEEYKLLTGTTGGDDSKINFSLAASQAVLDSILEKQEQRSITKTININDIQC